MMRRHVVVRGHDGPEVIHLVHIQLAHGRHAEGQTHNIPGPSWQSMMPWMLMPWMLMLMLVGLLHHGLEARCSHVIPVPTRRQRRLGFVARGLRREVGVMLRWRSRWPRGVTAERSSTGGDHSSRCYRGKIHVLPVLVRILLLVAGHLVDSIEEVVEGRVLPVLGSGHAPDDCLLVLRRRTGVLACRLHGQRWLLSRLANVATPVLLQHTATSAAPCWRLGQWSHHGHWRLVVRHLNMRHVGTGGDGLGLTRGHRAGVSHGGLGCSHRHLSGVPVAVSRKQLTRYRAPTGVTPSISGCDGGSTVGAGRSTSLALPPGRPSIVGILNRRPCVGRYMKRADVDHGGHGCAWRIVVALTAA